MEVTSATKGLRGGNTSPWQSQGEEVKTQIWIFQFRWDRRCIWTAAYILLHSRIKNPYHRSKCSISVCMKAKYLFRFIFNDSLSTFWMQGRSIQRRELQYLAQSPCWTWNWERVILVFYVLIKSLILLNWVSLFTLFPYQIPVLIIEVCCCIDQLGCVTNYCTWTVSDVWRVVFFIWRAFLDFHSLATRQHRPPMLPKKVIIVNVGGCPTGGTG